MANQHFITMTIYSFIRNIKTQKIMQDNHYYILKPAVGTEETGMAFPAVESYDDYDFDGQTLCINLILISF
jgi:hypothetical protein